MPDLIIQAFSMRQAYQPIYAAMQDFTAKRDDTTIDEIWVLEHEPVFTQGLAGRKEHVLDSQSIPVIQTDRGGQVTYHGPGQLMVYLLLDVKRLALNSRAFVRAIESTVIKYLASLGIVAHYKVDAPGVYVHEAKIASIGLRVRKQGSYHGVALNVMMNLVPFSYINPCGFKGLSITQIADYQTTITIEEAKEQMMGYFVETFSYNDPHIEFILE